MKLTALIFSFVLILAVSGHGQRKVSRPSTAEAFATSPIDAATTKLPIQYRGVDPKLLFNALEKRSKESKGEFETTAAFRARMDNLESTPLVGTIRKDTLIPLALWSETIGLSKVTSRYDADDGALNVTIEMSSPVIGVETDLTKRSVSLRRDFQPSESYVGQNAYGAKVTIKKTVADIFELLVENFDRFQSKPPTSSFDYHTVINAKLEMTPAEAMAAKPNLKVLAIVRLRDPFFLEGYLSHKPTITDPKDTFAVYQYIVGQVEEFWIFDYPSGRIYAKWRPR